MANLHLNLQGQVIGINTLIAGMAEQGIQAQGIGFAIAIDTAKPIADELVATGRVVHPYMGIYYQALNSALAARLGLGQDQDHGIVIADVASGSPASKAGLQQGDVLTAIDGSRILDESTLGRLLKGKKPGATGTLDVIRNLKSLQIRLQPGERPSR